MQASGAQLTSLEHQLNEAANLIAKMRDGLSLKEAQEQMAALKGVPMSGYSL